MRTALLAALVVGAIAVPAAWAQQPAAGDREGVRRAALDYLEGFYEGDSAKIVRSVRPNVRNAE
jgi:hypothetical protein